MSPTNSLGQAVADLRDGLRLSPLWSRVAIEQTVTRYRRTMLGPFWIASTTLATGLGLTLVFGALLGGDWRSNFPFVLAGLMSWALVGGLVTLGAGTFIGAAGLMQSQRLPLSFHVSLSMSRALIDFAHQLIAFWIIMAIVRLFPAPHWHLLVALPIALLTGFFLSFPIGMLATRYRDINYMVAFIMQTMFLLTPVFWRRANLPAERRWLVDANPFAHLLEILRQPLLGHPAPLTSWIGSLLTLAFAIIAAVISLMLYRRRVVFWL